MTPVNRDPLRGNCDFEIAIANASQSQLCVYTCYFHIAIVLVRCVTSAKLTPWPRYIIDALFIPTY